jgi:hypothetical protein
MSTPEIHCLSCNGILRPTDRTGLMECASCRRVYAAEAKPSAAYVIESVILTITKVVVVMIGMGIIGAGVVFAGCLFSINF